MRRIILYKITKRGEVFRKIERTEGVLQEADAPDNKKFPVGYTAAGAFLAVIAIAVALMKNQKKGASSI